EIPYLSSQAQPQYAYKARLSLLRQPGRFYLAPKSVANWPIQVKNAQAHLKSRARFLLGRFHQSVLHQPSVTDGAYERHALKNEYQVQPLLRRLQLNPEYLPSQMSGDDRYQPRLSLAL